MHSENSKPFSEWNVDALCIWFDELGLGIYEEDVKKCLKNGAADLINATSVDLEKEINFKSPLHCKKIILAVRDITGQESDELFVNAGKLDTMWVSTIFLPHIIESAISVNSFNLNYLILGNALVGRYWTASA